jgi:uncharacterized protein YciI
MIARLLCCLLVFGWANFASAEEPASSPSASPEAHAAKSGAPAEFDSFMVVLLVRPKDAPQMPKAKLDQLQEKHLANIRRLAEEGKILKAGPFEDYSGRNVRGMFILKTNSIEEARAWVKTDPSIQAGRLHAEYLKWYVEKGSLK